MSTIVETAISGALFLGPHRRVAVYELVAVETAISGALFLGHPPPNGSRGAGKVETAIPMALYLGPDPDIDLAEVVKFPQPSQGLCACDRCRRYARRSWTRFTSHRKGFVLATLPREQ